MSAADSQSEAMILQRLAGVSATSLVDAGQGTLRVLPAYLQPVRSGLHLVGRAFTVLARDDLMPMLAALRIAGPGDVLVVAAGDQGAVSGELFASEAQRRGVTGLVIDGFCRDRATLAQMDLPVYARGSVPYAPSAQALPVIQVPITVGSVDVSPGDLLLGDADGIVVGTVSELAEVIERAETIERHETALRDLIVAGSSLFDHLNFTEHLAALEAGQDSRLTFS